MQLQPRVLVLGGTAKARELAGLLCAHGDLAVTSSLAGITAEPVAPAGSLRRGGFAGADELAAWLRAERIAAVVDATHPFATGITANVIAACRATGVPLLVLRRAEWHPVAGERWHSVADHAAAARLLPELGSRVFLAIGRTQVAAYAGLDELTFLLRSVQAPAPPVPARLHLIIERGPFTVAGDTALLREHRIEVLVAKNSGGEETVAKLHAARALGLEVIMIERPRLPEDPTVDIVESVSDAVAWVRHRCG
ncbi:MAG: cobalt-precorrin-6A reductase [Sciscionella sp.]